MLKALLFDLDGTLVDSLTPFFGWCREASLSVGGPPLCEREIREHFGKKEESIFRELLGDALGLAAYRRYVEITAERLSDIHVFEGMVPLLAEARASGIGASVVTGRGRETTEMILEHQKLRPHFSTVVVDDDVARPKPAPDGILLALQRLALRPEEVVFVGDTLADMGAAHAAGCRGIAALWAPNAEHEALRAADPYLCCRSPAELAKWLRSEAKF